MKPIDRRAADVAPRSPEWILDQRMPRTGLSLIVGADGTGKSTLVAGLTAQWTTGELTGQPEMVHLSLAEDDAAAVTVPRLMAAGADCGRVVIPAADGSWVFPDDLEKLGKYLESSTVDILVLDPLDHHVDSLAQQAGRKTLGQLDAITRAADTSLVGVHHFNKSGRNVDAAIGGGRGVKGIARSILVWGPEPSVPVAVVGEEDNEAAECHVLAHHKSSFGPRAASLVYERVRRPHAAGGELTLFELIGEADYTPAQVYEGPQGAVQGGQGRKRAVACELILRFLTGGPRAADELRADLESAGIAVRTFERARRDLAEEGVIEQYQAGGQHWWRISVPDAPPAM